MTAADSSRDATAPPARRGAHPRSRRQAAPRRAFTGALKALDGLTAAGAKVSVHVADLDRDAVVLAGDDFLPYPVADLGAIAVLLEVATQIRIGKLDPGLMVRYADVQPVTATGTWAQLRTTDLPIADLAVLAASVGDPAATNALLQAVGLTSVRDRLASLGLTALAVLDANRDHRGPDDAPHVAVGTTKDLAALMGMIVNGTAVDAVISAQVGEWLNQNTDLSLVASATGLDPFRHEDDKRGLLFINKTGRADGVRAEAGVLAGPRAGVSYAITICFDDLSVGHRLRVNDAMRAFGVDLMEYVH